jgi:DNA-binding MarR family transcriptional regulator
MPQAAAATFTTERIARIADFRVALRTFERRTEEVARRCGLTPRRYLLLLLIKGAPDESERLTMGQLAERLSLSANAVTELATRAEQAGLIRREPSRDDARVTYLRATAKGERVLLVAVAQLEGDRRAFTRAFEAISEPFRLAVG